MNSNELQIKHRHLPHWILEGSYYFITFCVFKGYLSKKEQEFTLKHVIKGNGNWYHLIAAVVMPDHTHLILCPEPKSGLSDIMKGIKGVTARQINNSRRTRGQIWQHESFDRIIRNSNELIEKLNYILNNPLKKGLIVHPWDYSGLYIDSQIVGRLSRTP